MALRVVYDPGAGKQPQQPVKRTGLAGAYDTYSSGLKSIATGLGKKELDVLKGVGTVGQSILDKTIGGTTGVGDIYRPKTALGQKATQALTRVGTGEKIGAAIGDVALYALPGIQAAKAERLVNILASGIRSPIGAAVTRVGLKSLAQGATAGATKFLESGGQTGEALKTAATAGVARAALGTVGEVARGAGLDKHFYQLIFKNAKADMATELNDAGLANLQRTKPELYKTLVESGTIKERVVAGSDDIVATIDQHLKDATQVAQNLPPERLSGVGANGESFLGRFKINIVDGLAAEGKTGAAKAVGALDPSKFSSIDDFAIAAKDVSTKIPFGLNKTVAEEALDRGLKGSLPSMANEVVGKKYETEYLVQNVAQAYKKPVSISEPQFERVLRGLSEEYKDVGFNELSDDAARLADVIKDTKGKVPATVALEVRRLLDKFRFASSYEKPVTSLSLSQANLKTLADTLRLRLNAIPGMGNLMKDYSFYIDALQDLSREAAVRGNAQVVSLIDSVFLGGSIGSASPVGFATAGIGRKLLQSGAGSTAIGQAIKNSTLSPAVSTALGTASGAIGPSIGE